MQIMRCLRGGEWVASRPALKTVNISVIRAVVDYGCVIYNSASKMLPAKLEVIQLQALRLRCGAMRTTPVPAVQVKMGEMLLEMKHLQMTLTYWATLREHDGSHLNQRLLEPCQELGSRKIRSFRQRLQK